MRRGLIALLLALCFYAAPGWSETCTFNTGASTWGPIGTVTGAGTSGCTSESLDDLFIIPSGAVVTCATGSPDPDLIWDGVTSGTGLKIQGTGEFHCLNTTGDREIRLPIGFSHVNAPASGPTTARNTLGIEVEDATGVLELAGVIREGNSATPGEDTTLSRDDVFTVGEVYPCPTAGISDCAGLGDTNQVMVVLETENYNVASGHGVPPDRNADLAFQNASADDLICFGPFQHASRSGANCYEIVSIDGNFPDLSVTFDVRQSQEGSEVNQLGYPLARRAYAETAIGAAAVNKGETLLTVGDVVAVATRHYYRGSWVYLESGTAGVPYPHPFRTMGIREGGANDVIMTASPSGIPYDLAASAQVWIGDVGVGRGDQFFFMAPVRVTSATAAAGDGHVAGAGTMSLSNSVFDALGGGLTVYGDFNFNRCDHLVIRDENSLDGTSAFNGRAFQIGSEGSTLAAVPEVQACEYVNITGGATTCADNATADPDVSMAVAGDNCSDGSYGIFIDAPYVDLTNIAIRHRPDDAIVGKFNNTVADINIASLTIDKFLNEYANQIEESGQMIDMDTDMEYAVPGVVNFTNFVCAGCGASSVIGQMPPGGGSLTDLVLVGVGAFPGGDLNGTVAGGKIVDVTNYSMYGFYPTHLNRNGSLMIRNTTNAAFYNYYGYTEAGIEPSKMWPTGAGLAETQRNILVRDVLFLDNSTPFQMTTSLLLDNVAFVNSGIDPRKVAVADMFLYNGAGRGGKMRNVTVYFGEDYDFSSHNRLHNTGGSIDPGAEWSSVLHYGAGTASGVFDSGNMNNANMLMDGQSCIFGDGGGSSTTYDDYNTPPIIDIDPGLADPENGDVSPMPGGLAEFVGCGVLGGSSAPGVRNKSWGHYLNRLEPLFMGSAGGGGGGLAGDRPY